MSNDDDKIGGVKNLKEADAIKKAQAVGEVSEVEKTQATDKVVKVRGAKTKTTRVISAKEREKLFSMINEEADKMFESGALPKGQKEVVTSAVKQVIDASIIDDEEE